MSEDAYARIYAALTPLYAEWSRGVPGRFALVADGAVPAIYDAPDAARAVRGALHALPAEMTHALVVALWPLEGWRHPRFVVESYRRHDSPPPLETGATGATGAAASNPLARDFLLAERLRHAATAPDDLREPYLLIKDGALLARCRRVTQARQVVDAAQPPLAPVVFTSLRLGRAGVFSLMVLQALTDTLPMLERPVPGG